MRGVNFRTKDTAKPVRTRDDLDVLCHRELSRLRNAYLWHIREENGLTVWINPDGHRKRTAEQSADPVLYWYPRSTVDTLLENLKDTGITEGPEMVLREAERILHTYHTQSWDIFQKEVSQTEY